MNKLTSTKWQFTVFVEIMVTLGWLASSIGWLTGDQAVTTSQWVTVTTLTYPIYLALNLVADKFPNKGWINEQRD